MDNILKKVVQKEALWRYVVWPPKKRRLIDSPTASTAAGIIVDPCCKNTESGTATYVFADGAGFVCRVEVVGVAGDGGGG